MASGGYASRYSSRQSQRGASASAPNEVASRLVSFTTDVPAPRAAEKLPATSQRTTAGGRGTTTRPSAARRSESNDAEDEEEEEEIDPRAPLASSTLSAPPVGVSLSQALTIPLLNMSHGPLAHASTLVASQTSVNTTTIGGAATTTAGNSTRAAPEPEPHSAFGTGTLKLSAILAEFAQSYDEQGAKMSVVNRFVEEVDLLPVAYRGAQTIFLSNNSVACLCNFYQFEALSVLSIANNCITDMEEVKQLQACPRLQILNLQNNPITQAPNYRMHVIVAFPKLRVLDSKEINASERNVAAQIVKRERTTLQLMLSNELLIKKLERIVGKSSLHAELRAAARGNVPVLNRTQVPDALPLDLRLVLKLFDADDNVTPDMITRILTALRLDVTRVHQRLLNEVRAAGRMARPVSRGVEFTSWDAAFSEVMLFQQNRIARLLAVIDVETERAVELTTRHAADHSFGALQAMRELEEDDVARIRRDREDLIRELQGRVVNLTAHEQMEAHAHRERGAGRASGDEAPAAPTGGAGGKKPPKAGSRKASSKDVKDSKNAKPAAKKRPSSKQSGSDREDDKARGSLRGTLPPQQVDPSTPGRPERAMTAQDLSTAPASLNPSSSAPVLTSVPMLQRENTALRAENTALVGRLEQFQQVNRDNVVRAEAQMTELINEVDSLTKKCQLLEAAQHERPVGESSGLLPDPNSTSTVAAAAAQAGVVAEYQADLERSLSECQGLRSQMASQARAFSSASSGDTAALARQVAALTESEAQWQAREDALRKELREAHAALAVGGRSATTKGVAGESPAEIEEMKTEVATLKDAAQENERQLFEAREALARVTTELEEEKENHSSNVEGHLKTINKVHETHRTALGAAEKRAADSLASVASLQRDLTAAKNDARTSKAEQAKMERSFHSLTVEATALRAEVAAMKEREAKLTEQKKTVEGKLREAESTVSSSSTEVTHLRAENESLQSQVTEATAREQTLHETIETLETQLESERQANDEMSAAHDEHEAAVGALEAKLTSLQRDVQEAVRQRQSSETALASAREALKAAEKEAATKARDLEERLRGETSQRTKAEEALRSASSEVTTLKAKTTAQSTELQAVNKKLALTIARHDQADEMREGVLARRRAATQRQAFLVWRECTAADKTERLAFHRAADFARGQSLRRTIVAFRATVAEERTLRQHAINRRRVVLKAVLEEWRSIAAAARLCKRHEALRAKDALRRAFVGWQIFVAGRHQVEQRVVARYEARLQRRLFLAWSGRQQAGKLAELKAIAMHASKLQRNEQQKRAFATWSNAITSKRTEEMRSTIGALTEKLNAAAVEKAELSATSREQLAHMEAQLTRVVDEAESSMNQLQAQCDEAIAANNRAAQIRIDQTALEGEHRIRHMRAELETLENTSQLSQAMITKEFNDRLTEALHDNARAQEAVGEAKMAGMTIAADIFQRMLVWRRWKRTARLVHLARNFRTRGLMRTWRTNARWLASRRVAEEHAAKMQVEREHRADVFYCDVLKSRVVGAVVRWTNTARLRAAEANHEQGQNLIDVLVRGVQKRGLLGRCMTAWRIWAKSNALIRVQEEKLAKGEAAQLTLKEVHTKATSLHEENVDLLEQLHALARDNQKLQEELDKVDEAKHGDVELLQKYNQARERERQLVQEKESLETDKTIADRQAKSLEAELKEYKSERASYATKMGALQKEIDEKSARIKHMTAALESNVQSNDERHSASDEKLAAALEVAAQLRRAVEERDERLSRLSTDATHKVGDVEKLTMRLRDAEDRLAQQRTENTSATREIHVLRHDKDAMQEKVLASAALIQEKNATIKKLQYEVAMLAAREAHKTEVFITDVQHAAAPPPPLVLQRVPHSAPTSPPAPLTSTTATTIATAVPQRARSESPPASPAIVTDPVGRLTAADLGRASTATSGHVIPATERLAALSRSLSFAGLRATTSTLPPAPTPAPAAGAGAPVNASSSALDLSQLVDNISDLKRRINQKFDPKDLATATDENRFARNNAPTAKPSKSALGENAPPSAAPLGSRQYNR